MHAVASKVVQIQHSTACVFPKIASVSPACFRAVILLVHLLLPWCCPPTKCSASREAYGCFVSEK